MIGYRQALIALLLTVLSGVLYAQNNTNSPYTRYGYGELADPGSGNSRAMGGIAYGLRDPYQTNTANPASYTAVDSLTFIFDGGVTLQKVNFSDGTLKRNANNSSFDYITMHFRASRWAAVSLGMLPYSNVGYNLGSSVEESEGTPAHTVTYSGEGGLHQVYLGLGFKILKNLSVGTNISYLWGDITRTRTQNITSVSSAYSLITMSYVSMRSYKLDFGAQYSMDLGNKHGLTLGAVFSPGHDLSTDSYMEDYLGSGSYVTTRRDTVATFSIPMTVGLGATYTYNNRLTVGADFMLQTWNKATYMNDEDAFCKRGKLSVGAEYVPNPMSRHYLNRVKYRVGAYYSKPYYKIDGERAATEYGLSAGFGLSVPRTRSLLSLTAQYVRTEGAKAMFLDQNAFRLCIGVTFNERWFFKRKVD